MMNEDKYLNLTDVEWRLMHAIWSLGEPPLGQIIKDVADQGLYIKWMGEAVELSKSISQ